MIGRSGSFVLSRTMFESFIIFSSFFVKVSASGVTFESGIVLEESRNFTIKGVRGL